VNPGFGGQTFIPNTIRKIKEAVQLRQEFDTKFKIEIDGGIDRETIVPAFKAGVDIFVSGSSIFGADNITAATAELKNLIK
jgi:ribulose-phosphate 3-epimerase